MKHRIFSNRLPIVLHVLAWAIIVIIPRYIINTYGRGDSGFLIHFYVNTAFYGFLFYLNYLWLVPKFFFRGSKAMYFIVTAGVVVTLCAGLWFVNDEVFRDKEREMQFEKVMTELNKGKEPIKPPIRQFRLYNYFYTSILICGFSLGLGVLEKLTQNEKDRKELEKAKLNSELAFLKNQISPHFFFNTLNNIYSLIKIDTDEAQESVLKLSKLMRYLLYESDQATSKLSDELAFMTNYIDLMRLRLNKKVELSIELPEKFKELNIPPLLFVPFVENAFKHGISYREKSFIDIKMTVNDSQINFITRNSINNQAEKDQYSGIGLENVKKRLNLLFPDTHRLDIRKEDEVFSVELFLETKPPES